MTVSTLSRKVAGSASILVGRRVAVMAMSAAGTAVVARLLDVASFGFLAAGLAAFWLASSLVDFGFGLLLGRDLAAHPDGRGRLLRAVLQVQVLWALVVTTIVVGLALASGAGSTRGLVILALAPAVATGGVASTRQVFIVLYRTRRLTAIDLTTNVAQLAGTVIVAALGGGPLAVALVISASWVTNDLLVAVVGVRLVDAGRPVRADRTAVVRRAAPLGLVSFFSSVYFTVDLLLLGWLVSGRELGSYAAACKILSLLVVVPGLLMGVALPAFAESVVDPEALRAIARRVTHWLATAGLPVCIGAAIFARPLVAVAFGPGYGGAVPLVRILCAAGVLTLLANVLGTLLLARSMVRPLLVQSAGAIVFNVAGNLALVPSYGVTASAWLTVATEAIVCASSAYALRGSLGAASLAGVCARPLLAAGGLAATGLALASWPMLGIPAAAAVFCVLLLTLGAWPAELQPRRWRTTRP
jgi:O-antigen/teichoic acid export membrane protein